MSSRFRTQAFTALAAAAIAAGCTTDAIVGPAEGPAALAKSGSSALVSSAHAIHVRLENMVLNSTVVDLYSFNARQHGDDTKGHFQLYQERIIDGELVAVIIASGEIECLTVVGNRARVGGRVSYTTFPEGIPVGSELTWSATDDGPSAKSADFASQPLGNNARAYCALGLPYPETPVRHGKVTIKD